MLSIYSYQEQEVIPLLFCKSPYWPRNGNPVVINDVTAQGRPSLGIGLRDYHLVDRPVFPFGHRIRNPFYFNDLCIIGTASMLIERKRCDKHELFAPFSR